MNNMKTKIKYHTETHHIRDSKCPIRNSLYDNKDYNHCKKCEFFQNGYCVTKEYKVKLEKGSIPDDDDPYGGMPSTDYWWKFPCSKCGDKLEEHSGMSNITDYTEIRCKKCSTLHILVDGGYSEGTFLIPKVKKLKL